MQKKVKKIKEKFKLVSHLIRLKNIWIFFQVFSTRQEPKNTDPIKIQIETTKITIEIRIEKTNFETFEIKKIKNEFWKFEIEFELLQKQQRKSKATKIVKVQKLELRNPPKSSGEIDPTFRDDTSSNDWSSDNWSSNDRSWDDPSSKDKPSDVEIEKPGGSE
jgi:hypothetical protein